MTTKYECDRCAACCQGTLIVEAHYLDALRERRILGANLSGRDVSLDELDDEGRCVVIAAGSPCRFLDDNDRCTIYPTRPNACVGFEAGHEQCQQARCQQGLPPLQPLPALQPPLQDPPRA
ncbi:MAG TPA: YkgJ family cysteine cluster protein [Phycisphaerae bacterium]|nr:YkgJ family cysteine cluster protein [Phycisphaerae bacterium]HRY70754.1 YkgJ family cysteine cluster protein [Phycisphaerae bacterium]HSA28870.1 YkgJ family cysteine cluster protein [Phycisphaerae bacterium]